ncbi:acylphosphatase [Candidatus Fermentibacteria bacterium]|nr:acylphosphatase [Candidatus Fermentibacteria bacterium]
MICREVRVTGVVQGVGFRYWAVRTAQSLGLRGWVRNRLDGSVELLVCGSKDSVESMVRECRRGPSAASVDNVRQSPADCGGEELDGFSVRF